ncbi:DUF4131 domain-containing protein [Mesorhizobium plurifarium]|uniref:ComEC/Rec2 family competence protein n=1 Tax=Sinorhizobium arboris TaxID=76745 RepID=UPI00048A31BF|nr:ComEC/Rec2 family competence protein [Sinorhizobium arboris]PST24663.1 DUF4131 domain-containing protein [Mesorhizobium plurifarium]
MGESRAQTVVGEGERSAWPPVEGAQVLTGDLPSGCCERRTPAGRHAAIIRQRIRSVAAAFSLGARAAVAEEREYGHGFVLIPVVLALGSLTWFALPETVGIAKLAALLCVFGISAVLCRGGLRNWRPLAVAPALFAAGMLLAAAETARLDTVILDTPVTTTVRGTVLSRDPDDRGRWRYLVEIHETSGPRLRRAPKRTTLLARSAHEPFPVGAMIEGKARLSPPSGPALPGLNDFAFSAYFKGVGAVGFFYGAPHAPLDAGAVADPSRASPPGQAAAYLAQVRESVGNRIRSAIGGDTGAIAAALVTGEERAISREAVEMLRAAGLSHVLAISGLNMVLAAGTFLIGARTLLSFVPGLAERYPVKKIAAVGALLMVFFYILISGGAVSALRSWIMISIMLVAVFFDRVSISLRNVALAALVILAWTPSAAAGPGFQMSFAATLALVAGYSRWRDHRRKDRETSRKRVGVGALSGLAIGTVATSVIGGLATAVYAAAHFNRLPGYGLAANVLTTPLISILIMPFALFAMLLMPFGLEHYPLAIMGQGLDWMLAVARYVASLDGEWTTGRMGGAPFFLIAFGGILLCVLRTRLALAGAGLIALGACAIALEPGKGRPSIAISEDAQLIGLITADAIATNRSRPPEFIFSQWQRALATAEHKAPLDLATEQYADVGAAALLASAQSGVFACRKGVGCAGRSREGWTVAVIEKVESLSFLCGRADLVVVASRRPSAACPSGGSLVISIETLRRTGAVEIHAEEERTGSRPRMRIVSSFSSTERPWQRHRRYDWRSGSFVPQGSPL